ncbi:carboxypeptidase-like regulatory domain-containing protein [Pirellulaceae bacterium SH467]
MPNRSIRPATLRESWRPRNEGSFREFQTIVVRRTLFSLALTAVLCFFAYLLFAPFYHPNVRLYFFSGGDYRSPWVEPVPFFRDAAIRFLSSDGYFDEAEASSQFREWSTPAEALASIDNLLQENWHTSDLPIVYLSGKTSMVSGRAALHSSDLNPGNPDASAVLFEDIFSKLSQLPVQRVLVLIEFDSLPTPEKPGTPSILDNLPELLKQPDYSKLWVIASHSATERSHLSVTHRAPAFLIACSRALAGEGLIGDDKKVSFHEFYRFVERTTAEIIQSESQGEVAQTPLFLGDRRRLEAFNDWIVASVPESTWKQRLIEMQQTVENPASNTEAPQEAEVLQQENKKAQSWLSKLAAEKTERVSGRIADEISDNIDLLPSFVADPIKVSIGLRPDLAEDPASTNKADSSTPPADLQLPDGPDLRSLPAAINDSVQLLQLARQYCSYVERNDASPFRPWESMPVAWAYTISKLQNMESKLRLGGSTDTSLSRAELVALIVAIHQLATDKTVKLEGPLEAWKEQLPAPTSDEMPPLSLKWLAIASHGTEMALPVTQWTRSFEEALIAPNSEGLIKLLETPAPFDQSLIADCFYARRLTVDQQAPWELARRALRLFRKLDHLLSEPASGNRELSESLQSAFQEWLRATRLCTDLVPSDWETLASQSFDKVERDLVHAEQQVKQVHLAKRLWYRVHYEWNGWKERLASPVQRSEFDVAIESTLGRTLPLHRELTEQLISLESCSLESMQRTTVALEEQLGVLQDIWIQEASRLDTVDSEPKPSDYWQIYELLEWSYYNGPERDRLLQRWLQWIQSPVPVQSVFEAPPFFNADARGSERASFWDALQDWRASFRVDPNLWDRASSLETLRRQENAVRQIRVDSPNALNPRLLFESIARHEAAQLMRVRRACFRQALKDATEEEYNFYWTADMQMREKLATILPSSQDSPFAPNDIVAQAPQQISLESTREQTVSLRLRNRSPSVQEVWVLADLDAQSIAIESLQGEPLYFLPFLQDRLQKDNKTLEERLAALLATSPPDSDGRDAQAVRDSMQKLANGLLYPIDPVAATVEPTIAIPPNSTKDISFRISRSERPDGSQKVLWKVVTRSQYTRLETRVRLPSSSDVRLIADVQSGAWRPSSSGIDIDLFPNRAASARFGLRSSEVGSGKYDVRLWIPQSPISVLLPTGELSNEASATLKTKLPEMKLWQECNEIELTSAESTAWLSPKTPPPPPPNAAGASPTESTSSAPSVEGASSVPMDTVSYGVIAEFQNQETGRTGWRLITMRTRHPRSYIDARCSYDSISETAELVLTCQDPSLLPASGIPVAGRVRENLPKGTEMKLSGTLLPDTPLRLYCKVPVTTLRLLNVELDIEEYPRAFVASIPCWRTFSSAPVRNDRPRIQIENVLPNSALVPGQSLQDVQVLVDAWADSFLNDGDRLEIGWDEDQDREFEDESPLVIRSDRDLTIQASRYGLQGTKIYPQVTDFQLDLPPPTPVNRKINLLARLQSGGQSVWSTPIPVVIDGDKPSIQGMEIRPSTRLAKGTDLDLRVSADDAALSGIAGVQAAIDTRGVLKWSEIQTPVMGVRQEDQTWRITLPTSEAPTGMSTLVVAAIDRAGNVSEIERRTIELVGEEEWQKMIATRPREIVGLVTYAERSVSNAEVTLSKESGETIASTSVDSLGLFRLQGVLPGKYKLSAMAVIKNRPRRFEESLTVKGEPTTPIRKEIQLK